MAPMPPPSWEHESDSDAGFSGMTSRPVSLPPPPLGHPAASAPGVVGAVPTAAAGGTAFSEVPEASDVLPQPGDRPDYGAEPAYEPAVPPAPAFEPRFTPEPVFEPAAPPEPVYEPTGSSLPVPPEPEAAPARSLTLGRHAGVETAAAADAVPTAPGLKVLLIGGAEPLGGMIAERLIRAGHRLAVQGVTIPADAAQAGAADAGFRTAEPLSLDGDRADAEDVVHTVARAEVVLGGLDAVVILPANQTASIGLDADAATWADAWSLALTTEVLAAACAAHIAARSFLARRKAGRIVLVTNGRDGALSAALPTAVTRAALGRLGADLTRELGPHGIGVSVVTSGPGGLQEFAVAQVADVVEALMSTPVLSGVSSRIG